MVMFGIKEGDYNMKIYESAADLPPLTDPYDMNWECKNKECWIGPCFTQHEKKPRGCPGFDRGWNIPDPEPKWEKI